ncbi:hypothetical protein V5F40_02225 [Xanthobacter sp. DSM 14520]|uniref:hypothetical protein n=1 Tax=Xanthobacter autotrophicus (strain ATCC BAA-1158 / Py2) TaxID=78245 RepID=UPI0037288325
MRGNLGGVFGRAILAMAIAGLSFSALAQSVDPLAPPPDLGAQGLPVPVDGTAIYGQNTPPPEGMMAIPVPPSTCAGVAQVVRTQGLILIPTGNGNAQRYVRDERFCAEDQVTKPAWIATSDNPRCFVGYTCGESNDDGSN